MTIINEVKQRTDIVEVISDYVPLQKSGRNFKGLCPFHNEKHPSFFVFPEQQTWHCFGACGTGGDIFAFLMQKEGIDFGQALRLLAQRIGVPLGPSESPDRNEDEEKEKLFYINEAATEYYHHLLMSTKIGEAARSYLSKRKIMPETIEGFRLGFSADSWDALKSFLMNKGHKEGELAKAGLIIEKEEGNSYDRFRNRLMFPICDAQGRVAGFGARALDDSLPKYINSPQTLIFDKGSILYGIDKATSAIIKNNLIIIVEGYMDVILTHQHGFGNIVASMGTSMTEKQVAVARKLTKNIALALDADAAGEEATLRGLDLLAHYMDRKTIPIPHRSGLVKYENVLDAEIKVITLPKGKDPDEVMREDIEKWQSLVNNSLPLVDFLFEKTIVKLDLNTARDKSTVVDRLLPVIAAINDPIRQAHYLQKLAALVKVDMNTIKASLSRIKPSPVRRLSLTVKPATKGKLHSVASSSREEYCLALLLQYPELREYRQDIFLEYFKNSENREIFMILKELEDITSIKERLDPALHEHLDAIINKELPSVRNNIDMRFIDSILELKRTYFKDMAARQAEAGDTDTDSSRLEEGLEISHQLRELDARKGKKRNSSTGRTRR